MKHFLEWVTAELRRHVKNKLFFIVQKCISVKNLIAAQASYYKWIQTSFSLLLMFSVRADKLSWKHKKDKTFL